jgi:hypothetical protein
LGEREQEAGRFLRPTRIARQQSREAFRKDPPRATRFVAEKPTRQTRSRTVNLRQGKSNAVRRYHVCRPDVGVPHKGQIALTALGTTLIITEPSGSIARLAIRQRSLPTSRSSSFPAALPPPAYS